MKQAGLPPLVGGCLLLAAPLVLPAQSAGRCSKDSAPPMDTIPVYLGFSVPTNLGIPTEVHGEYLLNAEAIASELRPPPRWEFPLWPGTYNTTWPGPPDGPTLGLEGLLVFRVKRTGRLLTSQYTAAAGAPGLAAALMAALHRADSAGLLTAPAAKPEARADTTIALTLHTSLDRRLGFIPFAYIRLAVVRIDDPVYPEDIPKPNYPLRAMSEGRSGSFEAEYVVDETGHVVPASFQILYSDGDEFVRAGIRSLLKGRFRPARRAGCPVPELVRQRISFNTAH